MNKRHIEAILCKLSLLKLMGFIPPDWVFREKFVHIIDKAK